MRRLRQEESVDSPDMTPMLDIVFIMLIFFIVSTSFVQEEAIDWQMLSSTPIDDKPKPKETLLVSIDKSGLITILNNEISIDSLRARVQAALSQKNYESAVVRVASSASTAILVKAVDNIKLAGITNVTVGKQSDNP